MTTQEPIEQRIDRLQTGGIIDLHFDLLMDLYEKRQRKSVLETEFLPELEVGNVGVVGVAIYIENRYLPTSACVWRSIKLLGYSVRRRHARGSRSLKAITTSRRHAKN